MIERNKKCNTQSRIEKNVRVTVKDERTCRLVIVNKICILKITMLDYKYWMDYKIN